MQRGAAFAVAIAVTLLIQVKIACSTLLYKGNVGGVLTYGDQSDMQRIPDCRYQGDPP